MNARAASIAPFERIPPGSGFRSTLRGLVQLTFAILSSLKYAVWIAVALAVATIVGTLFPQQEDPDVYVKRFGEGGYRWITRAGLIDVFHTWWYATTLTPPGPPRRA